MTLKKTITSLAAILSVFIVMYYFVTHTQQSSNQEINSKPKITVGYLAIAGALPIFVADTFGYFKDQGLNVELVQFKSSNEIAIAAATGRIDVVGIGATNAVVDAATSSQSNFRAFLVNGYTLPSLNVKATDYLIARRGLSLNQLNGKKVAFFPGSISRVFAKLIFPKIGLDLDKIEYIEMSPPNWKSALDSGAIDAVTAIEPFAQQILESGNAEILVDGYYAQVMPDVPLSAGWFVKGNLNKKQEIKLYRAVQQAISLIELDKEKALKAFDKFTKIPPSIYSSIGLNKWRLSQDKSAKDSLKNFLNILLENQAIKGIPVEYVWTDWEK